MSKEKMCPLLKYPGGKSKEIEIIKQIIPSNIKRYFEPFVGGGSVFFAFNIKESFINDKSLDLILFYRLVKEQNKDFKNILLTINNEWKELDKTTVKSSFFEMEEFNKIYESSFTRKKNKIEKLEKEGYLISKEDKETLLITARKTAYYTILRSLYNKLVKTNISNELRSALFYFLREYCYSSMFRFSKNGDFNVPYGGMSYNFKYLDNKIEKMFSNEYKNKFSSTTIDNDDFEVFLDKHSLASDDFIFLDPPYDSDFSTYDNNVFDKKEQIRLRDCLKRIKAKWVLIIKKTDFIYELYKDFKIIEYDMSYAVSFKNRNDKDVKHLLIINY